MNAVTSTPRERLAARGWAYPEGWEPSSFGTCRSCKAAVLWCVTPAGKRSPVNADGTSHFSTCPQADNWRKPRPRA